MEMTTVRARIIAVTFMAGLAWSEGRAVEVVDGSSGEKAVDAEHASRGWKEAAPRPEEFDESRQGNIPVSEHDDPPGYAGFKL
jgi:hypothetical protein